MKYILIVAMFCVPYLYAAKKPPKPKTPKREVILSYAFDGTSVNDVYAAMTRAAGTAVTFVATNTCMVNFRTSQSSLVGAAPVWIVADFSAQCYTYGNNRVFVSLSYKTRFGGDGLLPFILVGLDEKKFAINSSDLYWQAVEQSLGIHGSPGPF